VSVNVVNLDDRTGLTPSQELSICRRCAFCAGSRLGRLCLLFHLRRLRKRKREGTATPRRGS